MGIGEPNAVISSTRTNPRTNVTTTPLTNQPCGMGVPGPKDMAQYGGAIRYLMVLDPSVDIQAQDVVFLQSWGSLTVDPTKPYRAAQADPSGFRDLELIRVPLVTIGNT